jgi:site-specific DNA recombinase
LLAPDAVAEFLAEYHAERKRLATNAQRQRRETDKRLLVVERQIKNIVDAIAEGMATAGMKAKLLELERDKEMLVTDLNAMSMADIVVEFHPATVEEGGRTSNRLAIR